MWKYVSENSAEYLILHDCECNQICGSDNNLTLHMEWMEVLSEHPNKPFKEAHQSGTGVIEFCDFREIHFKVNGEEIQIDKNLNGINYSDYEVIDYKIEKSNEYYRAKLYMMNSTPFKDIAINIICLSLVTRYNELNDVSWFDDEG